MVRLWVYVVCMNSHTSSLLAKARLLLRMGERKWVDVNGK